MNRWREKRWGDWWRVIKIFFLILKTSLSNLKNLGSRNLKQATCSLNCKKDTIDHYLQRTFEGKHRKCIGWKLNIRKECSKWNFGIWELFLTFDKIVHTPKI